MSKQPRQVIIDEPDLDELLSDLTRLELTYPLWLKILLWGFGSLLVVAPIWAFLGTNLPPQPTMETVAALFTECLGLVAIYYAYLSTGKVILTEEKIRLSRFGMIKQLAFSQIHQIKNKQFDHALVLGGPRTNIRIEKQLQLYPLVYDVIQHKTEHLKPEEPDLTFPVRVSDSMVHYWWFGVLLLLGLTLAGYAGLQYVGLIQYPHPPNLFTVLTLSMFAILWIGVGIYAFAQKILRIDLLPTKICIGSVFTTIEIPASALLAVRIQRRYVGDEDPYYDLEITLDQPKATTRSQHTNLLKRLLWRAAFSSSASGEGDVIVLQGKYFDVSMKTIGIFIAENYLVIRGQ